VAARGGRLVTGQPAARDGATATAPHPHPHRHRHRPRSYRHRRGKRIHDGGLGWGGEIEE
jgi:hypothetical protein